jgi:tripartite-type tricarboxylate transporter receptor subunit TctC
MKLKIWLAGFAAIALMSCLASSAQAQATYPNRPVKVVIGFPPGTAADVIARILSQKLTQILGQQFVVENRPGASSTIGTEMVVRSANNGYTLLLGSVANTINASLLKDLPFNFAADLAPVSLVASAPNILAVHPSLPVHNVQQLIVLAKSKPGEIFYASSGNGTAPHLSGELFNLMTGTKLAHIPYKGSSEAVADLLAGRVAVTFSPASTVLPHIKAGTLRALASTGARRATAAPDLPTVAESGFPGFETAVWFGLLAPASTPGDIIERLASAVAEARTAEDVKAQFATQGIDPMTGGPKEFAAYIRSETEKWAKVVQASGARVD